MNARLTSLINHTPITRLTRQQCDDRIQTAFEILADLVEDLEDTDVAPLETVWLEHTIRNLKAAMSSIEAAPSPNLDLQPPLIRTR